jgi:hypothetical protein
VKTLVVALFVLAVVVPMLGLPSWTRHRPDRGRRQRAGIQPIDSDDPWMVPWHAEWWGSHRFEYQARSDKDEAQ